MVMKKEEYFKYFFLALFALVAYASYRIAQPFIGAILASFVLAYTFYPVYRWLVKRIKSPAVSGIIVSLVLVFLLIAPLFFFANTIVTDARVGYLLIKQKITSGNIFGVACPENTESLACKLTGPLKNVLSDPTTNVYLQESISKATTFVLKQVSDFLISIPSIALNLVVTFFLMFYLFIDGERLIYRARKLIPISIKHQNHIIKKLQDVTFAVVYGSLIVALIQGALGGLGFWMFGVGSPIIWGLLMALLALVPLVGTAVIWLPAGVYLIVLGSSSGDTATVWRGIGLLLWGVLVVSTIDNILKPKIIGERAGVHPGLILIGALGGLATIGFIGFVVGPLVLALLKTFVDIYEKEELKGNGD